jgi:zinc protease
VSTDVVTAKTDSAVVEIVAQLGDIAAAKPVADSELAFARRAKTQSLPLQLATVEDIAGAARGIVEAHLPLDYYDHLVARIDGVTAGDVRRAVARWFDPVHLAIVVVGDREKIEPGLRSANVAPVVIVPQQVVLDGEPRVVGASPGTHGPTRMDP